MVVAGSLQICFVVCQEADEILIQGVSTLSCNLAFCIEEFDVGLAVISFILPPRLLIRDVSIFVFCLVVKAHSALVEFCELPFHHVES